LAYEPISDAASPTFGRDKNGATASVKSTSKIDYTDFYSKYQKRRNPFLLLQEKHLPHIRLSIDTNINPIETKNSIKNIFDLPLLSPLKTNSTYFPKISAIKPRYKNMKIQLGQKLEKSKRKLNIKYIDIINMNKDKKLLIDEINKVSQFEEEISRHIYDPLTKNKIKHTQKITCIKAVSVRQGRIRLCNYHYSLLR